MKLDQMALFKYKCPIELIDTFHFCLLDPLNKKGIMRVSSQ
jgi:hypothetical protein